ncbi:amino acid adenylation domain-containing protein [Streptomyces sp. NPDC056337]|uniref:non-ribosomal peptide synthetase n=1 Tax=Streptomyces sp. NPDC056337 TaxID=3345787 RepID=UPI0035DE0CC9
MNYEFPLSSAQGRLLVLDQLHPGTAQYNVPVAFSIHGPFDVTAFERALNALVVRHEALRTTFQTGTDGCPVQVVAATQQVTLTVEEDVPADQVDARLHAEATRPFDTNRGPLLRAIAYQVDDGSHCLLLTAHHIVCDGWSLNVMLGDLSTAYASYTTSTTAAPAWEPDEPELQYPDFAAWQCEHLANGGPAQAVAHWVEDLHGAPTNLALPTDKPYPARRTTDGGVETFLLSQEVCARLDDLARQCGCTRFTVLFAAFAAFLSRLCAQQDLVVGVPVSGRDRPELHDMVGLLTNTLAVRANLPVAATFLDLIEQVRTRMAAGKPHQDAPYEAVVDAIAPPRIAGREPLVQATFSYNDADELALHLPGADVGRVSLPLPAAKFDLVLYFERSGNELAAQFVYSRDLFEPATAESWARSFRHLLDGLLTDPARPMADAPLLTPQERDQVLHDGDRTSEAAPSAPLVPDVIAALATDQPQSLALTDGVRQLTYQQLLQQADHLAARLQDQGVGPEVPVALLLPRTVDVAIAALAVLRAGGAYVPLDLGNPPARLAHMVKLSGAQHLLATAGTADLAQELKVPVLRVDQPATAQPLQPPTLTPDHLAYILYTSGSTGTPKGIAVEHRALTNLCQAVRPVFPVEPTDRVLQYVNLGFDVAVSDLFFPLTAGAELHIADQNERLGDALLTRLRDSRITYAFLPPAAAMSVPEPGETLPDLRTLAVGGEPCPAELVERWAAPHRRIVNAYGPSEVTVYSTTAELRPRKPIALGTPVPGVRVMVLDAQLRPVPTGVAGEIYVAGASVGRGYAGRPALTAERFIPDPYGAPGTRMYRSGDLGRRDADGAVHYLGRVDSQVKLRGFRIELGEIESILSSHPQIALAAAAVHGPADDRYVAAYVVGTGSGRPDITGIREHLADKLPSYMVPTHFLHLDSLPMNRSGKVDRSRLPEPPAAPQHAITPHALPTTATEHRVFALWARTLGHDQFGVHDNFFDIGGNSIRLLAVATALRQESHYDVAAALKLVDLFRHTTVAAVAAHIERLINGDDAPAAHRAAGDAAQRGRSRHDRLISVRNARTSRNRQDRKGTGQ